MTGDFKITGDPKYGWCVYVIECEWAQASQRRYVGWKHAASKAEKRVYVGSTNDLERRMQEHKERTGPYTQDSLTEGSVFTQQFQPQRLIAVHYRESEEDARDFEEWLAEELSKTHPGWFVWQS